MDKEVFKDIPSYEGMYQASNLGRIKSLKRFRVLNDRILKQSFHTSGYYKVCLNGKVKLTHSLIAMAFLNHTPSGNKLVVDHIDNNRLNNNVDNLQVITQRINTSKDRKNGASKYLGVTRDNRSCNWTARIFIAGNNKYLGTYKYEIDAHNAYQEALKKYNVNKY